MLSRMIQIVRSIGAYAKNIVNYVTMPLTEVFADTALLDIFETLGIEDLSLITFTLGSGFLVFLTAMLVKWTIDIIL